jgi:hypothetical protein
MRRSPSIVLGLIALLFVLGSPRTSYALWADNEVTDGSAGVNLINIFAPGGPNSGLGNLAGLPAGWSYYAQGPNFFQIYSTTQTAGPGFNWIQTFTGSTPAAGAFSLTFQFIQYDFQTQTVLGGTSGTVSEFHGFATVTPTSIPNGTLLGLNVAPEPGTWALMGIGVVLIALRARRAAALALP